MRNCCPRADRKRVTEHRPKRSKGTRERKPSWGPTQDQILCGRLTILRQLTHAFVAWTGFKPKREFRSCLCRLVEPKGSEPPFTRQPRHTTMHQFEDEADACRYKEKTSARSGTGGCVKFKVARAAGSIEEQCGWHAGRGRRLDSTGATAPNDMGGYRTIPHRRAKDRTTSRTGRPSYRPRSRNGSSTGMYVFRGGGARHMINIGSCTWARVPAPPAVT